MRIHINVRECTLTPNHCFRKYRVSKEFVMKQNEKVLFVVAEEKMKKQTVAHSIG